VDVLELLLETETDEDEDEVEELDELLLDVHSRIISSTINGGNE
jgi:hypothetical protein